MPYADKQQKRDHNRKYRQLNRDKIHAARIARRAANRPEYLAREKEYYYKNRHKRMYRQWWRQYGLTPEDWQRLLDNQDNVCAICASPSDRYCVDHDHATGTVRGILCQFCNTMLGFARDNPDNLIAGSHYLRRSG